MSEVSRLLWFSFEDGCTENLEVVEVGPNLYRLRWSVISSNPRLYLGDVIEAHPSGEHLRFIRRVERSGLRTFEWCLAKNWIESAGVRDLLDRVEKCGGSWEGVFGGFLLIHLPPDSTLDPDAELKRLAAA